MGPNARRRPKFSGEVPEPMTHQEVDRLLRSPRRSAGKRPAPREEWIIVTRFPSDQWRYGDRGSDTAYWGTRRDGSFGLTPYRGNAIRYDSENEALYEAYSNKEIGRIREFEVVKLPPRPPLKGNAGTGGRQ